MNYAVVGPTGIGKTMTLMRELDRPLLIRHFEDLKRLDIKFHKNLIFDDMTFCYLSRAETMIHLLDRDYHATIRVLRDTVTVPPSINRWFTHNNDDFIYPLLATEEQRAAIDRRITIFYCNNREDVLNACTRY